MGHSGAAGSISLSYTRVCLWRRSIRAAEGTGTEQTTKESASVPDSPGNAAAGGTIISPHADTAERITRMTFIYSLIYLFI